MKELDTCAPVFSHGRMRSVVVCCSTTDREGGGADTRWCVVVRCENKRHPRGVPGGRKEVTRGGEIRGRYVVA